MRYKGSLNAPFWFFLLDNSIPMNGAPVTYVHCTGLCILTQRCPRDTTSLGHLLRQRTTESGPYRLSESPKVCIPDGFAAGGTAAREVLPDDGR